MKKITGKQFKERLKNWANPAFVLSSSLPLDDVIEAWTENIDVAGDYELPRIMTLWRFKVSDGSVWKETTSGIYKAKGGPNG